MASYLKFQTTNTTPIWICRPSNWTEESLSPMSSGSGSSNFSSSEEHHAAIVQVKKIRNVRKSDKYHCSICGDRPTGYHYDVLSCNGCKTFFRRTIINKRTFTCMKGGQCEFNKDFRCACRACRFNKCVLVGMNPSAIQFPAKYEDSPLEDYESDDDLKRHSEDFEAIKVCEKYTFDKELLSDSIYQVYQFVDEVYRREEAVFFMRKIGQLPIELDFSLTEVLRKNITIGKCYSITKPGQWYKSDPVRYWMVFDLYLNVDFAKTFPVFRELSELDQKALISHIGGLLHVAMQSFYSFFEAKSDTLTFPDGTNAFRSKMDGVQQDNNKSVFVNYYAEMYNLPIADFLNMNMNMTEYSFFKSIALFTPNSTDMSMEGRITVNMERERLMKLLKKYLIAEHGFLNGIQRFSSIILAISTFINYGEKRRNYIALLHLMEFDIAKLGIDTYLKKPREMEPAE